MAFRLWHLLCLTFISSVSRQLCQATPTFRHLVFMLIDDLGWNDVGYHNPDIISPTIDSLANSGIKLNQSYVQPVCTPSRAAFMTGIYPFRLGLQHMVLEDNKDRCAALDKKLFPEILKEHGYATHMVGKWHLGFCKWECTPTFRGFDSFYGYYNSGEDFYTKMRSGAFDFRANTTVDRSAAGNYSTFQYTDKVEQIIDNHDISKPLFVYIPFQSVHSPLQVPDEYVDKYPHIQNQTRKLLSAMVTALDDSIARVVATLKKKGIYNDTLIFFSSDNGGDPFYGGNNYPLRGAKVSIFEGGTRVAAFLHGPKLNELAGETYEGMIHAVDWFPTLLAALGFSYKDENQDGVNQWDAITTLGPSKRSEFVYNLDYHPVPIQGQAAIRVGDYKLMKGYPGIYQGWYEPEGPDYGPNLSIPDYARLTSYSMLPGVTPNATFNYLFNLKDDPTEQNNLYDQLPEVVSHLESRLKIHMNRYVSLPELPVNLLHNPKNYGGIWSPGWCCDLNKTNTRDNITNIVEIPNSGVWKLQLTYLLLVISFAYFV